VLSDIHSNLVALEQVLRDCGTVDAVWCLGDVVGYGPRPNEVVARLQAVGAVAVAGNHDWAAIGRIDTDDFNPDAAAAAQWTARMLLHEASAYLAGLPQVRVHDQQRATLVHGSPRDPLWEYLLDAHRAAANLAHFATQLCLFGHTHIPSRFVDRGDGRLRAEYAEPDDVLDLQQLQGKLLLNPGSVGQPRDGDPRAAYLLLDLGQGTATWRRVEYDVWETQQQMIEAKLPRWLVERLALGR